MVDFDLRGGRGGPTWLCVLSDGRRIRRSLTGLWFPLVLCWQRAVVEGGVEQTMFVGVTCHENGDEVYNSIEVSNYDEYQPAMMETALN